MQAQKIRIVFFRKENLKKSEIDLVEKLFSNDIPILKKVSNVGHIEYSLVNIFGVHYHLVKKTFNKNGLLDTQKFNVGIYDMVE